MMAEDTKYAAGNASRIPAKNVQRVANNGVFITMFLYCDQEYFTGCNELYQLGTDRSLNMFFLNLKDIILKKLLALLPPALKTFLCAIHTSQAVQK